MLVLLAWHLDLADPIGRGRVDMGLCARMRHIQQVMPEVGRSGEKKTEAGFSPLLRSHPATNELLTGAHPYARIET